MREVNWESQWALFAENFYDGKAHIDLSRFGGSSELLLLPGPGFGDLSHPTTYLMLELMPVKGEKVLDIGCGSGILSLAALKLGATSAVGIDIEIDAIGHAKKNAAVNRLDAMFLETLPTHLDAERVLLMNMILPEQKIVMQQKELWNGLAKIWITSGILASQQKEYLSLTREWGWTLQKIKQRGEWLGFTFFILS